jgi:hypothetical protein
MYLKFRLAYTLAHRLLYLKQKNFRVANTLPDGANQFTHLKKNTKEIPENVEFNNGRSIQN